MSESLAVVPFDAPVTMTSLQIAELVDKRHDNVKRTIEACAGSGAISLPQFEEVKVQRERREESVTVYQLDKRSSIIVVAQLCPEFTARIVDRWQELENELERLASLPSTNSLFASLPEDGLLYIGQKGNLTPAGYYLAALEGHLNGYHFLVKKYGMPVYSAIVLTERAGNPKFMQNLERNAKTGITSRVVADAARRKNLLIESKAHARALKQARKQIDRLV